MAAIKDERVILNNTLSFMQSELVMDNPGSIFDILKITYDKDVIIKLINDGLLEPLDINNLVLSDIKLTDKGLEKVTA